MPPPVLSGPMVPPARGGPARRIVIFLHGYGADGNDLISLAPAFAQALPDAAFYGPHAPEPCETHPTGRQWFSLSTPYQGPTADHDMDRASAPLSAFINHLTTQGGLTADQVALVGFSQGTMLALHVALRVVPDLAAVVGFSGALIGAQSLADSVIFRPPVLLVHGEDDQTVPCAAMTHAQAALKAVGTPVTTLSRPALGHGIDDTGLTHSIAFLTRVFENL